MPGTMVSGHSPSMDITAESNAPRGFTPPRPNGALMRLMGVVNRWLLLFGLPWLRRVPFVRDLPLARGYFWLRRLDLPTADAERLRQAVNPLSAAFLAPNHPEFGFDWMMDKEISTRVAPRMASWASHHIVASAPRFWLANNLVANDGGDAAVDYSVRTALRGDAVLLHPEGMVRWTADKVHAPFEGIAQLAIEAARRAAHEGVNRPVFIVPIVWKLVHAGDVSDALRAEMARIEKSLGLDSSDNPNVAERFRRLQENVLSLRAERFGAISLDWAPSFFERQHTLRMYLVRDLETRHSIERSDDLDRRIHRLEKAIRAARAGLRSAATHSVSSSTDATLRDDLAMVEEATRLGGFTRDVYGGEVLTQEQIGESLKRLRASLLRGGLRNAAHNFLPAPFGPRVAHVRVPEPILVDPKRAASGPDRPAHVAELLARVRSAQQSALDSINREVAPMVARFAHPNPFSGDRVAARSRSSRSATGPTSASDAGRLLSV